VIFSVTTFPMQMTQDNPQKVAAPIQKVAVQLELRLYMAAALNIGVTTTSANIHTT
jgi:hypothetical protein